MPSILFIRGWRLFFYANERHEPPHIHARKTVRKIIFDHFDDIVSEYKSFHKGAEE